MTSNLSLSDAQNIIANMTGHGRGLLAADESTGTIGKRFNSIHVEATETTRQAYRELLLTAPKIDAYIGGVILYDETIRQSTKEGTPFISLLNNRGIIPGIKVDQGLAPYEDSQTETVTKGLEGLSDRLNEYRQMGAQFAKWRAVITIENKDIPTQDNLNESARRLAVYAKSCHDNGLVPIVEPEVLMVGSHSIDRCYDVTKLTLKTVFSALNHHKADPKMIILKPNMVVPGLECPDRDQVTPEDIAEKTLSCFQEVLPDTLPAIAFLSGGQSDEDAVTNLRAINKLAKKNHNPWRLTFSYGRALQRVTLQTWRGNDTNKHTAQKKLLSACQSCSRASQDK